MDSPLSNLIVVAFPTIFFFFFLNVSLRLLLVLCILTYSDDLGLVGAYMAPGAGSCLHPKLIVA